MTNPIEYIDKQKLLTHLELRKAHYARVDQPGKYSELDSVIQEIESGTFDDHSAIEGITKLEAERNASQLRVREYEIGERIVQEQFRALEARVIQAEQERDEANRLLQKRRKLSEMWERNADSLAKEVRLLREEWNALLEGLKKIGGITLDGGITLLPHQALNHIHGITSSTIAKLEGSKPNDTPTT